MAAKIRPERVTRGDLALDFREDFLKLALSRDFETSSRAVKKIIGSHRNLTELTTRSTSFTRAVSGLLDVSMRQGSSCSSGP